MRAARTRPSQICGNHDAAARRDLPDAVAEKSSSSRALAVAGVGHISLSAASSHLTAIHKKPGVRNTAGTPAWGMAGLSLSHVPPREAECRPGAGTCWQDVIVARHK
jgi:hypothetical protein